MSVSCSWVRLYRTGGKSAVARGVVGDEGEAGILGGSVVLVIECWNTLGDRSSEDSSPWTTGPAVMDFTSVWAFTSVLCTDVGLFPVKDAETLQPDSTKHCGVTNGPGMKPGIPSLSASVFTRAGGSRRSAGPLDPTVLSSVFETAAFGEMGCWVSLLPDPWSRDTSAGSVESRGLRRGANAKPRKLSAGVGFDDWGVSLGKELPKSSSTVICFTIE